MVEKKSFVRRFENDTFESVFLKSVEIESAIYIYMYLSPGNKLSTMQHR